MGNDTRFISLALHEKDDYESFMNKQLSRILNAIESPDLITLIDILMNKVLVTLY